MTNPNEKQKPEIKTRQPQKKTTDTFANLRKPHPMEELLGLTPESLAKNAEDTPLTALTPPTAVTPPTPPTPSSVAPTRDFTKVANSIVRQALPAGVFTGKSKQLYDYLYSRTRGAIVPVLSARMPKEAIMRGTGIGSERTLYKNLRRLESAGLVKVRSVAGEHLGSEYTVVLPEELTPLTPPTHTTHPTHTSHKVLSPLTPQSGVSGVSLIVDTITTSEDPKTSFKTIEKNFDDEAFARFVAKLREAVRDLTGREISAAEAERWGELADVLVAELRIAAARTTVSSVPSFLAEHLRRRLWKIDKKQAQAEGRELPDEAVSAPVGADARGCTDCLGTGWWYPNGQENGVAKCRHAGAEKKEREENPEL